MLNMGVSRVKKKIFFLVFLSFSMETSPPPHIQYTTIINSKKPATQIYILFEERFARIFINFSQIFCTVVNKKFSNRLF